MWQGPNESSEIGTQVPEAQPACWLLCMYVSAPKWVRLNTWVLTVPGEWPSKDAWLPGWLARGSLQVPT